MLKLADKDFKTNIITMLKDVKENMLIMSEKIGYLRKKEPNGNSKTENYSVRNKSSLTRLNSR